MAYAANRRGQEKAAKFCGGGAPSMRKYREDGGAADGSAGGGGDDAGSVGNAGDAGAGSTDPATGVVGNMTASALGSAAGTAAQTVNGLVPTGSGKTVIPGEGRAVQLGPKIRPVGPNGIMRRGGRARSKR